MLKFLFTWHFQVCIWINLSWHFIHFKDMSIFLIFSLRKFEEFSPILEIVTKLLSYKQVVLSIALEKKL